MSAIGGFPPAFQPVLVAAGTATSGNRTPPKAIPNASRTSATGVPVDATVIGLGIDGGRSPFIHRAIQSYAALNMKFECTRLRVGSMHCAGPGSKPVMPRVPEANFTVGEERVIGTVGHPGDFPRDDVGRVWCPIR